MARIAIVGGTGKLGNALARRFVRAGHEVAIGSRSADAALAAAHEIGPDVRAGDNTEASTGADFVVIAIPYAAHAETLRAIRDAVGDAIVIDATVPLVPPKVMRVQLPAAGSAAAEAQALLGPGVRLVTAFHNVAAHRLGGDAAVDCDVLVFGDDPGDRRAVIDLVGSIGMHGLAGGALANAAAAEALTSVLIFMNKTYRADGAGIRFTNLPREGDVSA